MKSKSIQISMVVLPLILALSLSLTIWPDTSLAAKIGFFSLGTWFGVSFAQLLLTRKMEAQGA